MANKTILKILLGVNGIAIDSVYLDEEPDGETVVVIAVHPTKGYQFRSPFDGKRYPKYDDGHGKRRWRDRDIGSFKCYIEADAPRINIKSPDGSDKQVVAAVPWARHNSGFTINFEDTVIWMSKSLNKTALAQYMRIAWNTVGQIISRVKNDLEPDPTARFNGLVRIGIDETAYCKGHNYITTVVNHDNNEVIWAAPGHEYNVLRKFFDLLTDDQKQSIQYVSGDGAKWIKKCVGEFIPQAHFCIDPFHCC